MNRAITSSHWVIGVTRLRDARRHAALACAHLAGGLGHLTAGLVDALVWALSARWAMAGLTAAWRAISALAARAAPILVPVLRAGAFVAIALGLAWAAARAPTLFLILGLSLGAMFCAYLVWTVVLPVVAPIARAGIAALTGAARGLVRLASHRPLSVTALVAGAALLVWGAVQPLAWVALGVLAVLAVLILSPAVRAKARVQRRAWRFDRLGPAYLFAGGVIAITAILWWALSNPMDAGLSAIVLSGIAAIVLAVILLARLGEAIIRWIRSMTDAASAPAPQAGPRPGAAHPPEPAGAPSIAPGPPRSRSAPAPKPPRVTRPMVLIPLAGGRRVIRAAARAVRQVCAATLRWIADLPDALQRRLVRIGGQIGALLHRRSRIAMTAVMVGLLAAFLAWRQPGPERTPGETRRASLEGPQPSDRPAPLVFSAAGATMPIAFAAGYRNRLEGGSGLVDADRLSVGDVCRHRAIAAIGAASSDGAARANEALARHRALLLAAIVQRSAASCNPEARPAIIAVSHGEAIGADMRDQRGAIATSHVASALRLRTDTSRVEACLVQTGSHADHPALRACPQWSMASKETETE